MVDGLTNVRHHTRFKVFVGTQVCLTFFSRQEAVYFLHSVGVLENSGDILYEATKKAKEEVETNGGIVVAVVGDNHSAVQNALQRIGQDDGGCLVLRCGELLLRDVGEIPPIKEALQVMSAILEQCTNRKVEEDVRALQVASGKSCSSCPRPFNCRPHYLFEFSIHPKKPFLEDKFLKIIPQIQ